MFVFPLKLCDSVDIVVANKHISLVFGDASQGFRLVSSKCLLSVVFEFLSIFFFCVLFAAECNQLAIEPCVWLPRPPRDALVDAGFRYAEHTGASFLFASVR